MISVVLMFATSITVATKCKGEFEFGADRDRVSVICERLESYPVIQAGVPVGNVSVKINGVLRQGCSLKISRTVNNSSEVFLWCP